MGAGSRGGSKSGGKTTGSTNTGSRAPSSSPRPRETPKGSMTKNASGAKTYTDTKTGVSSAAPKFSGASIKGLTSKDPGNVARNRAGAAKYGTMSERIAASGRDGNADKAAAQAAYRTASAGPASAQASRSLFAEAAKKAAAAQSTAPKPGMMATKPPAGYRPGIDPEYNYRSATAGAPTATTAPRPAMSAMATPMMARVKPTITLAKGGKAKPKMKK